MVLRTSRRLVLVALPFSVQGTGGGRIPRRAKFQGVCRVEMVSQVGIWGCSPRVENILIFALYYRWKIYTVN